MLDMQNVVNERVDRFRNWYGDGADGASPTSDQWRRLFERPPNKPLNLINFFKFRSLAVYDAPQHRESGISGEVAFDRYAAASIPAAERAGVRFMLIGPAEGMFLGGDEDWDLVVIGSYPDIDSLVELYSDSSYRAAFHHRTAACARQKVFVCSDD